MRFVVEHGWPGSLKPKRAAMAPVAVRGGPPVCRGSFGRRRVRSGKAPLWRGRATRAGRQDGPGEAASRDDSFLGRIINTVASSEKKGQDEGQGKSGGAVASALSLGGVIALLGTAFYFKESLQTFLISFTQRVDAMGPEGYLVYMAIYVILEIFAIPAIPLTMTGGLLFGPVAGTVVVSICATLAAAAAFLIARYAARDKVKSIVQENKRFEAIDRAIGRDAFRVVALLRLSPLLPLALSNYLYGLTSAPLLPYVAGSWLGMLPGTAAYVFAGSVGRAFLFSSEAGPSLPGGLQKYGLLLGVGVTALSAFYITRQAKKELRTLEDESDDHDNSS